MSNNSQRRWQIQRNWSFWTIALTNLAVDCLTKFAVVSRMKENDTIPLLPQIFHFTYTKNTGAAFSLFAGQPWLRWLSLIVSLILICAGLFASRWKPFESAGWGFVLAGAAGNGIDRLTTGAVVDFIDLRFLNFAVFNWADVAINVGIVCLFVQYIWLDRRQ
jgi:signal peptidase II